METVHSWYGTQPGSGDVELEPGSYVLDNGATAQQVFGRLPAVMEIDWNGPGHTRRKIEVEPAVEQLGEPETAFTVETAATFLIKRQPGITYLQRNSN